MTTDASGIIIFDEEIAAGVTEPHGVSATATGGNGTSEFSYCRPSATPNLNWVQAQAVEGGSQTQQFITDVFQEKWFKFPVQPGATVTVKLTSLPGSAVSLHRDPYPIYNELIDPANAALFSAEAADAAFLPSGSLPSGSLPSGSLPSGSLPSGSLPSGSLPTGYLPSGSLAFRLVTFRFAAFRLPAFRLITFRFIAIRLAAFRLTALGLVAIWFVAFGFITLWFSSLRIATFRLAAFRLPSLRLAGCLCQRGAEQPARHLDGSLCNRPDHRTEHL